MQTTTIRKVKSGKDLEGLKAIATKQHELLGWVPETAYKHRIFRSEIFVAEQIVTRSAGAEQISQIVGFVDYHHRRNFTTTLNKIAVSDECFGQGIGRQLVEALIAECKKRSMSAITTRCLSESVSNKFFQKMGFILVKKEPGKKRALNLYELQLEESFQLDLF